MLTSCSVVRVADGQASTELAADEIVILNLKSGIYYALDPVGARVWGLIREAKSVADVRDTVVAEFDVEPARCEKDLLILFERLEDAGLIEVREGSPAGIVPLPA